MGRLYAGMPDAELEHAWEESLGSMQIRQLEHEMAMRYIHKAGGYGDDG